GAYGSRVRRRGPPADLRQKRQRRGIAEHLLGRLNQFEPIVPPTDGVLYGLKFRDERIRFLRVAGLGEVPRLLDLDAKLVEVVLVLWHPLRIKVAPQTVQFRVRASDRRTVLDTGLVEDRSQLEQAAFRLLSLDLVHSASEFLLSLGTALLQLRT